VLVVAYWKQAIEGAESFEAFPVSKELKHMGHGVANITRALDVLIKSSPKLVLQVAKSGKSQQARKRYKVTREGIRRVQGMVSVVQGEGEAMSADRTGKDYAAKAAEAEEAVKSVKDPELRRVAFEKILAHLLGDAVGAPESVGKKPALSKARRSGGSSRRAPNAKSGPKARVVELVDEDYFKKQRTIADVKTELANRGHHIPLTSLSGPLQTLTQERRLRRQKVAANGKGSKVTYAYSNW